MNVSLNWIKELVGEHASSLPDVDVIADTLTRIGHEVEEIRQTSPLPDSVIIGEVLETEKHPDADRLKVCKVRISKDEISTIICGAPNVAAGQFVPVATPGSVLPIKDKEGKPLSIKASKIRGIESNGMICAMDELALGEDHDGIMVLNDEVSSSDVGRPFSEACSIVADTILDVSLTPNRPDAASHRGLARDLCAALGLATQWSFPSANSSRPDNLWASNNAQSSNNGHVKISLPDEQCPRYVARWVHGVTIGPSPLHVRQRLESLGLRSVNNVVDATNWVLHEMGHPTHAFDAGSFSSGSLTVQRFDEEVDFTTLDHIERSCPAGTLFICDGDKPVAIAGVMGGLDSEVSDETTDILLESAFFAPSSIRKTSKTLGLQTDASYRYERGADPLACLEAAQRVVELIHDWAGGEISEEIADVFHSDGLEPASIPFDCSLTTRILGHEIESTDQFEALKSLGCNVDESTSNNSSTKATVTPPSFRPDLSRPIDLVEEVGRLWDYNRLPEPTVQQAFVPQPIPARESYLMGCSSACMRLGYREIQSNSLIPKDEAHQAIEPSKVIHTLNPVSTEATSLRPTLAIGGLAVFQRNRNRGVHAARCFEIGHVYRRTDGQGTWHQGIDERTHLWMGVTGPIHEGDWAISEKSYRFDHLKRDLLSVLKVALGSNVDTQHITFVTNTSNPLQSDIQAHGQSIGTFTELGRKERKTLDLDSPTFMVEVDLDRCFDVWTQAEPTRAKEVSKYPSIDYDFALVVASDVAAGTLEAIIRDTGSERLQRVQCFDVYEGDQIAKNTKSLAFRCTFLDSTKTLTFNEVEDEIKLILNSLKDKASAELRT